MISILDKIDRVGHPHHDSQMIAVTREIPAQILKEEKCRYTLKTTPTQKCLEFYGRIAEVLSCEAKPNVEVVLINLEKEKLNLNGQLYGTPEKPGVYLESVIRIE